MASEKYSNLDEIDKLLKLCRQNGVLSLKLEGIEFTLSENLPILPQSVIINRVSEEEEIDEPGLDPSKAADLKRLRQQQQTLKQLFNDY